ncbi:MAG: (d)CMP kinase [Paludibacteraceae bacterium]|nr:(d)CMP kinase [Paludibacteraceae bacterium]
MKKIIVAVDGPSSSGKSTIAKAIAKAVGYNYIDTGAMYRAVALYALRNNIVPQDLLPHLDQINIAFTRVEDGSQHTLLNGEDVEKQIRTLEVGNMASQVSPIKEVRAFLVAQQQAMGKEKGIVMDGRDIGTVVFPQAELKLFITASLEVRAMRRYKELVGKGEKPVFEDVVADINDRDYRDTHRAESPLRQAEDAILYDNSGMELEDQMKDYLRFFNDCLH